MWLMWRGTFADLMPCSVRESACVFSYTHSQFTSHKLSGARYPLLKRVSELKLLSLTAEVRTRLRMHTKI